MPRHINIMLADDDIDDQLFFSEALKEVAPGVMCRTAVNGAEALEFLQTAQPLPSLLFLDLNMPIMNGLECLSELKSQERLKDVPVIIFTTSNNPLHKDRSLKLGAKLFLTKPSDFKILKAKLREILDTDFSATD